MTKLLAIGGLILWLLSHGSIVFGETDATAEYFPLADGYSWTYRVTGTSGTYNETMTVLPGTTIINGVATKAIQYSGGNIDYFTSDINGIQLHRGYDPSTPPITTWTFSPPLVITYGTMSVPEIIDSSGIVWFTLETTGTFPLNYTATSETEVREAVSVPAGTYEAVRLRDSTRIYGNILGNGIDFEEWGNTWVVKHIGMIKQTLYDDEGREEEWVMTSTNVPIPPVTLDIDDDGQADALTDGLLVIRYLFGFRGDVLIDSAVSPTAGRTQAAELEAALQDAVDAILDVDGDGQTDALTDGLLVIRYLFGFRGDVLINSAVSPGGTRTSASEIEAYLEATMP